MSVPANKTELQSVMETHSNLPARVMYETMPHNKRMLAKGCPRLLRMVRQQNEAQEQSALSQSNFSGGGGSIKNRTGTKNWNVFSQKKQAMDALFERYKASYMSSPRPGNKTGLE